MRQVLMNARRLFPLGALVVLAACGGGEGGPGPGPGPTRLPASLAISPATDLVKLRASETLTAVATMTNGTTETVTATWSSDNAGVASVDASGRVTGAGSGQAAISAVYSGLTAVRPLRVLPDYQGRWSGDHSVANCVADGDWLSAGFCQEMLNQGPLFSLGLVLTQNRDAVTGTIDVGGDTPGAIEGPIRMNGDLAVGGTFVATVDGVSLEVTVSDWETRTSDNQRMTGRFRMTFRAAGLAGSGSADAELRVFNKTGAAIDVPGGDARPRRSLLPAIRKVLRSR